VDAAAFPDLSRAMSDGVATVTSCSPKGDRLQGEAAS
jgi:hypothetical protein